MKSHVNCNYKNKHLKVVCQRGCLRKTNAVLRSKAWCEDKWIHGALGTTCAETLEFCFLQAVNNWQKRQYKPTRVSTRPAKYNICAGKWHPMLLLIIYSTTAQTRTLNISRTSNAKIGNSIFYVYWTVHHCDSWRIKEQLDVTCYFTSLLMCSTCFGH